MDLQRHEFSEEVKQNLADFLKVSQYNNFNSPDDIWKYLLPRNSKLIDELKEVISEADTEVIIDLTGENIRRTIQTIAEESVDVTEGNSLNTTSIRDLVDSIQENLYTEDCLSDDIIKDVLNVTSRERDDMFLLFQDSLNLELVSKLGNSIIKFSNTLDKSQIAICYVRYLLLPKLFSEYSKQLETVFVKFLEVFLNITSDEFSKQITEITICPKYIDDMLYSLEAKYKYKLLRDFVSNATKLTQGHFPIIEALLPKEVHIETVQKLIELISSASTTFSTDKAFGKLLLNILKCSGSHTHHFQQQLITVVGLHQSVWKNKLQKQMRDSLATHSHSMMSQSLRY